MARLWGRMGEMLGTRWAAFGEVFEVGNDGRRTEPPRLARAAQTWAEELGDLPVGVLAEGLRAVARQSGDWWPTLGAFRALCLDGSLPVQRTAAYRWEPPARLALADQRPVEVRRAERLARTAAARQSLRDAVRGRRDGH